MITHDQLGCTSFARSRALYKLINSGKIKFGGNISGKIYGMMSCRPGKRMKAINRIFFKSEQEAIAVGYRPCGICMTDEYKLWKAKL